MLSIQNERNLEIASSFFKTVSYISSYWKQFFIRSSYIWLQSFFISFSSIRNNINAFCNRITENFETWNFVHIVYVTVWFNPTFSLKISNIFTKAGFWSSFYWKNCISFISLCSVWSPLNEKWHKLKWEDSFHFQSASMYLSHSSFYICSYRNG